MMNDMNGLALLAIILLCIVGFALVVFLVIFWILMIVDCATRKRMSDGERIAWILVLLFLGILGAGIYYFVVKRR